MVVNWTIHVCAAASQEAFFAVVRMHSAVCSSVSAGVSRRLVESSGGCCSVRKSGHAGDCQGSSRPGFGALRNLKEGSKFFGIARIGGVEKLRVVLPLKGGAGFLYAKAFASTSEESASYNGNVGSTENGRTEARVRSDGAKLSGGGEQGQNLVHALHEATTVFQSAMEEQEPLTRGPWFAQKWLGIDKNAWMRALAYQAITHSRIFNPR